MCAASGILFERLKLVGRKKRQVPVRSTSYRFRSNFNEPASFDVIASGARQKEEEKEEEEEEEEEEKQCIYKTCLGCRLRHH